MNKIHNRLIISVTSSASEAIAKLKKDKNEESLLIRIGVKQGGCSGMSYIMYTEHMKNVTENDKLINYPGFDIVCDFKSILLLYNLSLDYNDSLVGGGFCFINPNAIQTCGCGKSFTVDEI